MVDDGEPSRARQDAPGGPGFVATEDGHREHGNLESAGKPEGARLESLERAVVAEEKENEAMRAMLRQQAAQIQNVSEQLAITPPSTRLVVSRGTRSVPALDAIPSASKSAITK